MYRKIKLKKIEKLTSDLFKIISEIFNIDYKNMVGLATGGGANMIGKNIWLDGLFKKYPSDSMFLHYMIHMNTLAVWILPDNFTDILNLLILIINKSKYLHI